MVKTKDNEINGLRLDKWLWTARFYKTRALASEAIKGGKIDLNNQRAKPSKVVKINDQIRIGKGLFVYEITVKGLAKNRGPASEAINLYEESSESIEKREHLAKQLKAENATRSRPSGRPSKRDRRSIIRFTRKS